jgi:hypothetical protein
MRFVWPLETSPITAHKISTNPRKENEHHANYSREIHSRASQRCRLDHISRIRSFQRGVALVEIQTRLRVAFEADAHGWQPAREAGDAWDLR